MFNDHFIYIIYQFFNDISDKSIKNFNFNFKKALKSKKIFKLLNTLLIIVISLI